MLKMFRNFNVIAEINSRCVLNSIEYLKATLVVFLSVHSKQACEMSENEINFHKL